MKSIFDTQLEEAYNKLNQESVVDTTETDPQDAAEEKKLEDVDDKLRKETIKKKETELKKTKEYNQKNTNGSAL
jgi:hypothetical protein